MRARRRWGESWISIYPTFPIVANRRLAVSIKVLVARRICRPGEKRISHPVYERGIDFSGFKWKVYAGMWCSSKSDEPDL